MIAEYIPNKEKNSRGRIFHVIHYIFDTDENGVVLDNKSEAVEFIGTSNSIITADPFISFKNYSPDEKKQLNLEDIKSAFEDIETKNKRVKQPFKHISISLREGESLTKSEWNKLVSEYVYKLGYADNHWLAVLHKTKNHHVHIVISCIENSAPHRKTKDGNDFALSAQIRNSLEDKFGLSKDNNPFVTGVNGNKVNNSHYKDNVQAIRDSIDNVLSKSCNTTKLPYFLDDLAETGIGCLVKLNGYEIEGLSYSIGVNQFKGSSLGIGYSWPELQKRGLVYAHQHELDDILYSNQRESAVSHLVKNAYDKEDIYDDRKELKMHYLLEPNNEITEFPENPSLHRYSVFRLLTPLNSAKELLLSAAKQKLKQLKDLRKSLYSIYDFVYRFSTLKIDSIMRYTQISSANLQFLFEQSPTYSPINKLVNDPNNQTCLENTGLLLVSSDNFNNDSPSTKDYSLLDSSAERQNSTDTEDGASEKSISVTVMGDYKTDNNDKTSIEAPVTILPDYHNLPTNHKEKRSETATTVQTGKEHRNKRPNDDMGLSL